MGSFSIDNILGVDNKSITKTKDDRLDLSIYKDNRELLRNTNDDVIKTGHLNNIRHIDSAQLFYQHIFHEWNRSNQINS